MSLDSLDSVSSHRSSVRSSASVAGRVPTIAQSNITPRSGQVSAPRYQHSEAARYIPQQHDHHPHHRLIQVNMHVTVCSQLPAVGGVTTPAVQTQANTPSRSAHDPESSSTLQLSNDITSASVAGRVTSGSNFSSVCLL